MDDHTMVFWNMVQYDLKRNFGSGLTNKQLIPFNVRDQNKLILSVSNYHKIGHGPTWLNHGQTYVVSNMTMDW